MHLELISNDLASAAISSAASPASPDTEGPSLRDLREQLRQAIEVHRDADTRARLAADVCSRAEHEAQAAREFASRLEDDADAACKAATERAAQRFAAALRAGSDLPPMPLAPEADNAALALALSLRDALAAAARELAVERDVAASEAAKAAGNVRALVDDIVDAEGRQIADELVSVTEYGWSLLDRLMGLTQLDAERYGIQFQKDILARINRHKRAIARNSLMLEQHNWTAYLDGIAADAKREWLDYARRLTLDAGAKLDAVESVS